MTNSVYDRRDGHRSADRRSRSTARVCRSIDRDAGRAKGEAALTSVDSGPGRRRII